jgi:hypothetical protein
MKELLSESSVFLNSSKMKRFVLLWITSLISLCSFSQGDTLVGFDGDVYIGEAKAKDVTISLYERNDVISTYTTTKNGQFVLDLERNKYYIVEFSKKGYVTKRILIDTKIASDTLKPKDEFNFDVFLIKSKPNVDYSVLDFPMAIIQFQYNKQRFDFDPKYTRERHSEQKEFMK